MRKQDLRQRPYPAPTYSEGRALEAKRPPSAGNEFQVTPVPATRQPNHQLPRFHAAEKRRPPVVLSATVCADGQSRTWCPVEEGRVSPTLSPAQFT